MVHEFWVQKVGEGVWRITREQPKVGWDAHLEKMSLTGQGVPTVPVGRDIYPEEVGRLMREWQAAGFAWKTEFVPKEIDTANLPPELEWENP